ncbi:hypothetical protein KC966_09720 [Proteus terrae]|uniref:GDCCVxC domain-containing (seleno)protein n=1 Tax=Proteus terrae TaxID=1574161 RepID=UPI003315BB7A
MSDNQINLMSEITCPYCHTLLNPLEGDCCVFCSYGTVLCPPIQEEKSSGKTSCCYQHESK